MKTFLAAILSLMLLAVVLPSCSGGLASQSQSRATGNLRLMVSDEPNDIADFSSLSVTVSKIGVLSDGSDNFTEITVNPAVTFDLTKLQGDNATEVWSGGIASGNYTKVFVYVDNISGVLNGENVTVKLPGDKLQISKPFTVAADGTVSFVFDITVIKAGNSGKYILKPQVAASGADQKFNDVTPSSVSNQNGSPNNNQSGNKPDAAGKPTDVPKGKGK